MISCVSGATSMIPQTLTTQRKLQKYDTPPPKFACNPRRPHNIPTTSPYRAATAEHIPTYLGDDFLKTAKPDKGPSSEPRQARGALRETNVNIYLHIKLYTYRCVGIIYVGNIYCAERVWLTAVTAQQSRIIPKKTLLFRCPKI